ncbi:hypothetical protein HME9304_00832 [Flagellimonas maritima]|uniref:Uncharacterized protein n=1 Tax=Flagellimonas maritima TaxID=1383885 RepID=A0A2Z4LPQ0_9FLAO|nr:hypothetical protein HME9304_00832 [Allomuricauda aurantiaca]
MDKNKKIIEIMAIILFGLGFGLGKILFHTLH